LTQPHEIRIKRGFDIALVGVPRPVLREVGTVRSIAISGRDFPNIRPEFRIEAGDRVREGQALFVDRKRPQIAFTAPAAGIVTAINRGRRRSLDSLVIQLDGDEAETFSMSSASPSPAAMRELLLRSGLWPSFLTRPFGRIPAPDAVADAIFVTAIDTNPLAPDPRFAISRHAEDFRRGLVGLLTLTQGSVFVCQRPGSSLCENTSERLRSVMVSGPHPAGLPGTHIHHLAPVGDGHHSVWQIGYQDVIAIGHLLATGRLWTDRIVAVAGTGVRNPSLAQLKLGASLDEALENELCDGPARVISGPVLSGRESGYLGRYHNQITVIARGNENPVSSLTSQVWHLLEGAPDKAIVPREAFERVMPFDILPVPLLRALSVGDVETAKDLGCLELLEEDLALISHVCTTGTDYGALLRDVLDQLAGDG
jgi:Na+-transporting NADH:ubiquinone oxidoreductase subunit A